VIVGAFGGAFNYCFPTGTQCSEFRQNVQSMAGEKFRNRIFVGLSEGKIATNNATVLI
jgi:hypothetical protein